MKNQDTRDALACAIRALKQIKEDQNSCANCKGDCTFCYNGTGVCYEVADEALKKIAAKEVGPLELPKLEPGLQNRILEIVVKAHLPEYVDASGLKGTWDEACKQVYLAATLLQTLYGSCDCSMEVKAGPTNPCPEHPYNEKEGCPKCRLAKGLD